MKGITLGFDVETTKLPFSFPWMNEASLVALGFAREDGWRKSWIFNHEEEQLFSIALNSAGEKTVQRYDSQLQMIDEIQLTVNYTHRLVGHNLKFDLNWMRHLGINFDHCKLWCTQVTEYLIRAQRMGALTLGDLSDEYLNTAKKDKVKVFWDAGYETTEIPLRVLIPYLEQDCINALAIYQRQVPIIHAENMLTLASIQNEASRCLSEIECNGMAVDLVVANREADKLSYRLDELNAELLLLFDWDIQLGSKDELSAGLYGGKIKRKKEEWYTYEYKKDPETKYDYRMVDYFIDIPGLGFEVTDDMHTKKPGVFKTGKGVIKMLKASNPKQRKVKKLLAERSVVAKALETLRSKDGTKGIIPRVIAGLVHPQYNQTVAKTGRLTSKDPKHSIGISKLCELLETPNVKTRAISSQVGTMSTYRRYKMEMEDAKIYYVTTMWSIERIAKLVGKRYATVRDYLYENFPIEFTERRKSLCYAKSKYRKSNPQFGKTPNNYLGLCEDGKGYLTVCKPHWYTGRKKYSRVFFHHIVVCEALGLFELPRGFCIHHIDGNKKNNSLDNLSLQTISAHGKMHRPKGSETIPKGSRAQGSSKRIAYVGRKTA